MFLPHLQSRHGPRHDVGSGFKHSAVARAPDYFILRSQLGFLPRAAVIPDFLLKLQGDHRSSRVAVGSLTVRLSSCSCRSWTPLAMHSSFKLAATAAIAAIQKTIPALSTHIRFTRETHAQVFQIYDPKQRNVGVCKVVCLLPWV